MSEVEISCTVDRYVLKDKIDHSLAVYEERLIQNRLVLREHNISYLKSRFTGFLWWRRRYTDAEINEYVTNVGDRHYGEWCPAVDFIYTCKKRIPKLKHIKEVVVKSTAQNYTLNYDAIRVIYDCN